MTRLNVGGPAQQALILTERLDPSRFDATLVAGRLGSAEADMLALRGSTLRPTFVPGLGREIAPFADTAALLQLFAIMRRSRPHIVHTHLGKAGLLGRIAAKLAGVPVLVHTFHGTTFRGYFGGTTSAALIGLERALAMISTRLIAISPRQLQEIRTLGIAREPKLIEIALGVDLTPFLDVPRGDLRRELGISTEVPLVGFVGRLVPIKAVDVFIEAMALLARRRGTIRGVVVGDGELRASLETLARARGLSETLSFIGWRADLRSVYGDLDVLVLTSDSEGTPVSVLEALTAGRPVVATAVGGVPDLLGANERGLLVPPRDPRAVADAVGELLDDRERASLLGSAGRRYVHPRYDARTLVERIDRLYADLVASRM